MPTSFERSGASLTQITNELKSAFDWLNDKAGEHGIQGPIIVTGWIIRR
jgi:hypothetical protein